MHTGLPLLPHLSPSQSRSSHSIPKRLALLALSRLSKCKYSPHPTLHRPTANNFTTAARGWSSWGIQADPRTTPSFSTFDQDFILSQCSVLTESDFVAAGYDLCALDSGWSDPSTTDSYGRIMYKSPQFNLSTLGAERHSMGLKMGATHSHASLVPAWIKRSKAQISLSVKYGTGTFLVSNSVISISLCPELKNIMIL